MHFSSDLKLSDSPGSVRSLNVSGERKLIKFNAVVNRRLLWTCL